MCKVTDKNQKSKLQTLLMSQVKDIFIMLAFGLTESLIVFIFSLICGRARNLKKNYSDKVKR